MKELALILVAINGYMNLGEGVGGFRVGATLLAVVEKLEMLHLHEEQFQVLAGQFLVGRKGLSFGHGLRDFPGVEV